MGRDIRQQEREAADGATILEWDGRLHRYRLRVLADGSHRIDRTFLKGRPWRRMSYPQDLIEELARQFYRASGVPPEDG